MRESGWLHPGAGRARIGARVRPAVAVVATALLLPGAYCLGPIGPVPAKAATGSVTGTPAGSASTTGGGGGEGNQLETAAHRAGETGRKVAMSLIALGFAIAAVVLAFRRDFKEAVGVFAIGVVAVLFAQEAGVKLVENLVHTLVG